MAEAPATFRVGAKLLGIEEVVASLANLEQGAKKMRPLMRRIGERIIEPSLRETLRREGRGTWVPEQRRVRKHRWLGEQGRIGRTLVVQPGSRQVTVGTTSRYGLWMFGRRLVVPTTVPRRARVLRMYTSRGLRFSRRTRAHLIVIPPRTLWQLWPEDEQAIVAETVKYLNRLEKRRERAEGMASV